MRVRLYPLLMIILFFACKKAGVQTNKAALVGTWEYYQYVGYPFPAPLPAGNGQLLIISDDNTFQFKISNTITIQSGHYELGSRKDCYDDRKSSTITFHYDNSTFDDMVEFVSVEKDTLTLFTTLCTSSDPGGPIYHRLH